MKSTELRIGNLVCDTVSGEWMRVLQLEESGATAYVLNRDKYPLPDGWKMGGIFIDQEVLERCGLSFNSGKWSINYGTDPEPDTRETLSFEFAGSHATLCSKGYVGEPFQYLHRLQNLFFALTGKELNVKLP